MLLTQDEFEARLKNDTLRIALIGMSNIGKSHWARRFKSRHGFHHYEVDDRIQENLSLSSISRSAEWMGQPYQKGYSEKAKEYLALETEMTEKAAGVNGNTILDTTGSVIYLDAQQLEHLSNTYLVIYLSARPDDIERLVKRFKTSPKPLIWSDHYKKIRGLSERESMMELYPSLLETRDREYKKLSDIEIVAQHIGKKTDLIDLVRSYLPVR